MVQFHTKDESLGRVGAVICWDGHWRPIIYKIYLAKLMEKLKIAQKFDPAEEKGNWSPVAESKSPIRLLKDFGLRAANSANNLFKIPGLENGKGMVEEMAALYYSINALLPDCQSKIIQFIGANEGEGTTTITRALARVISEKFGKSVRIVDTEMQKSGQLLYFDFEFEGSVNKSLREDSLVSNQNRHALKPKLFVKSHSRKIAFNNQNSDLLGNSDILEDMRSKLDFIFVDSLAVNISSSDLTISHKVDGVVLVVEAERTRWKVVENVRDKIIKHGGNILGVVLNKQRHYIPEFIYKKL